MSITAALIVYAVIWFLIFLMILPIKVKTQAEMKSIVPGTPVGAPYDDNVARKALVTTGVTFVIWAVLVTIILSGLIKVRDFDWMHRLPPVPSSQKEPSL